MRNETSVVRRRAACLAAFFFAALAGTFRAEASVNVDSVVAHWPDDSRLAAKAIAEQFGPPRRSDAGSLTWYGPGAWKRTVVHRSDPDGNIIEQAVDYRVPDERVASLRRFDRRISVNKRAGEMIVRSPSMATNFLLANAAHEIASGFTSVADANDLFARQTALSAAGKTSSYNTTLRFEPARSSAATWIESGTGTTPIGKPWDTSGTPWVVPAGAQLPP